MIVGSSGQLKILETNTLPGMTTQSPFPKAALAAGISIDALVNRLVSLAFDGLGYLN